MHAVGSQQQRQVEPVGDPQGLPGARGEVSQLRAEREALLRARRMIAQQQRYRARPGQARQTTEPNHQRRPRPTRSDR